MALPHNPLEKPRKLTPEERKAERKSREPNPFKPVYSRLQHYIPEGDGGARGRTRNSTLRPVSRKKQEAGIRPWGLRRREVAGVKLKGIRSRGFTAKQAPVKIDRTKTLAKVGRRGKRLAPGDRQQAALAHKLPCLCGCSLASEWSHLESRRFEETRHLSHLSIPACHYLHGWLDQGKGTGVRPLLLELAKAKGERLNHEDVFRTLSDAGFYTWLADRRLRER